MVKEIKSHTPFSRACRPATITGDTSPELRRANKRKRNGTRSWFKGHSKHLELLDCCVFVCVRLCAYVCVCVCVWRCVVSVATAEADGDADPIRIPGCKKHITELQSHGCRFFVFTFGALAKNNQCYQTEYSHTHRHPIKPVGERLARARVCVCVCV